MFSLLSALMLELNQVVLIIQGLCQEKTAFIYTSDNVNAAKISFEGLPEVSQFLYHQLQIRCIDQQDIQIQICISFLYKMPLLQLSATISCMRCRVKSDFMHYVCAPTG